MAHNLNFNEEKGSYSFVSSKGQVAWHGLGQVVEETLTAAECIEKANLDYEVVKTPNFTEYEGEKIVKEDEFSTLRTDTKQPLGTVGNRYEIVQNKDAFAFFDAIIDSKEARSAMLCLCKFLF